MLVWAGYTRVSRVADREGRLLSPELQAEDIRRWAKGRGVKVELLDPELNESGGRLDRPILEQALIGIEEGRYAGIVVAKLDRLSRSLPHSIELFERVERAGGEIVAVAEQIDSTTPAGRMQRHMLFTIGHFQLDNYKEGFKAAKASAVARGVWPTHRVPIGYRRGEHRGLEPDPETAPRVVEAFEQRAAGAPWSQIARLLGVCTSAAQKIVRSRTYLGELHLGDFVNTQAHEPLVGVDLWQAAQQTHPRPPRGNGQPALLAGLVRCAGCGRSMTPDNSQGSGIYRCVAHNANGRCEAPAIIAHSVIHPFVEALALDVLGEMEVHATERRAQLAQTLAAMRAAEAELEAFQAATSAAGDPALFQAGLKERVAVVEQARSDVAAARNVAQLELPPGDLEAVWPRLSPAERRHVLRGAIGAVWIRKGRGLDGRVRVIARGFEPSELSRPGANGSPPIRPVPWPAHDLEGEIRPARAEHIH